MSKPTWDDFKEHVKRNQVRYIVLAGVAVGFAIGIYTKRIPAKQVIVGTYRLFGENSPVVVDLTQKELDAFTKVAATFAETMYLNSHGARLFNPYFKVPKEFWTVGAKIDQFLETADAYSDVIDVLAPIVRVN